MKIVVDRKVGQDVVGFVGDIKNSRPLKDKGSQGGSIQVGKGPLHEEHCGISTGGKRRGRGGSI